MLGACLAISIRLSSQQFRIAGTALHEVTSVSAAADIKLGQHGTSGSKKFLGPKGVLPDPFFHLPDPFSTLMLELQN